jgi:hypothetical protein
MQMSDARKVDAENERHDAIVRRCANRMAKIAAVQSFEQWRDAVAEKKEHRYKISLALRRWERRTLGCMMNQWCTMVDGRVLCRRVMNTILRRYLHASLTRALVSWRGFVNQERTREAENVRLEARARDSRQNEHLEQKLDVQMQLAQINHRCLVVALATISNTTCTNCRYGGRYGGGADRGDYVAECSCSHDGSVEENNVVIEQRAREVRRLKIASCVARVLPEGRRSLLLPELDDVEFEVYSHSDEEESKYGKALWLDNTAETIPMQQPTAFTAERKIVSPEDTPMVFGRRLTEWRRIRSALVEERRASVDQKRRTEGTSGESGESRESGENGSAELDSLLRMADDQMQESRSWRDAAGEAGGAGEAGEGDSGKSGEGGSIGNGFMDAGALLRLADTQVEESRVWRDDMSDVGGGVKTPERPLGPSDERLELFISPNVPFGRRSNQVATRMRDMRQPPLGIDGEEKVSPDRDTVSPSGSIASMSSVGSHPGSRGASPASLSERPSSPESVQERVRVATEKHLFRAQAARDEVDRINAVHQRNAFPISEGKKKRAGAVSPPPPPPLSRGPRWEMIETFGPSEEEIQRAKAKDEADAQANAVLASRGAFEQRMAGLMGRVLPQFTTMQNHGMGGLREVDEEESDRYDDRYDDGYSKCRDPMHLGSTIGAGSLDNWSEDVGGRMSGYLSPGSGGSGGSGRREQKKVRKPQPWCATTRSNTVVGRYRDASHHQVVPMPSNDAMVQAAAMVPASDGIGMARRIQRAFRNRTASGQWQRDVEKRRKQWHRDVERKRKPQPWLGTTRSNTVIGRYHDVTLPFRGGAGFIDGRDGGGVAAANTGATMDINVVEGKLAKLGITASRQKIIARRKTGKESSSPAAQSPFVRALPGRNSGVCSDIGCRGFGRSNCCHHS